jgi:glycosyltransferase involved in cell wall biosynthesis
MTLDIAMTPRVTVLLSTYNGSRFLQQQLDSFYQQTYPNIGILVRDDGSTDTTRSILGSEQSGGRIEILEGHNNLGPAHSFFELLRSAASTGTEYAAFCDQDDVWLPEKIAHAVSALSGVTGGGPAMYCSRSEIVDEHLEHIGYTELPGEIGFGNALAENAATGCTIVLNRKAIDLVAGRLPDKVLMHDWWCYLVLTCFGEVIFSASPDIKYRQHRSNTIGIASNTFYRLGRKLRRFFRGAEGRQWISEQAISLLNTFGNSIPSSRRPVLDKFVGAKSSLRCRLQLALSRDIWRKNWYDDLALRILILINRF